MSCPTPSFTPPTPTTTPPHLPSLSSFSGYFKRSIAERQSLLPPLLPPLPHYSAHSLPSLLTSSLTLPSADHMTENCIGLLPLPLSLAPSFRINGQPYVVPMATEEPSVVAAASAAGKLIGEGGGGFEVTSTRDVMIGQVQVMTEGGGGGEGGEGGGEGGGERGGEGWVDGMVAAVTAAREELVRQANGFCAGMVRRGGGVLDVSAVKRESRAGKAPSMVVMIRVDVCDSMGANAINSICEGITPALRAVVERFHPRIGLRILSNLCVDRRTASTFRLPFSALAYRGVSGAEVARRVVEAYEFACDDEFRAVTNNKGVMNGIDAVAVATGQDWRAIEAAAHAWAALRHRFDPSYIDAPYGPLATYRVEEGEAGAGYLIGRLEVPISVGTAGGALSSHPLYRLSLDLLRSPSAATLAGIIVSVGLAQNFAAIRALAVEGIQRGHMGLHARNVAVGVGVEQRMVGEVSDWMVGVGRVARGAAERYWGARKGWAGQGRPSTLWVEAEGVRVGGREERVEGLVMFEGGEGGASVRLALTKEGGGGIGGVEEEVVGRRWGEWVGEGVGEVGNGDEGEWEVWRNVLRVLVTEGEGRSEKVGRGLVDAIVARLDVLRGQTTGGEARATGAELLQQLDQPAQGAVGAKL